MKSDDDFAELEAENTYLRQKVQLLEEQLRLARHQRFGASSERTKLIGGEQLGLFNEAEEAADPSLPEPDLEQAVSRRRKQKGKRDKDFSGLPVEKIIYDLPESERVCPDCGCPMHACGHKVARRELTVIPAQYKVTEHVETAYSCRHCEQNSDKTPMKTSKAPAPVIKNSGICSPSLLAQILYNKYALALPLYRQEADLKHMGIYVSRQNMANWAVYSNEHYFSLIFKLMQEELLKNDILHADETSVQVLREDGKLATSKSYMWLYRTGAAAKRPAVLFEYRSSREAEHPRRFLKGFRGYLHTDGYAGYHDIENVTSVGCWTHMRRKFADVLKTLDDDIRRDSPAQTGLDYCNRLFALEGKLENMSAEERHKRRNELSVPVADAFFAWAKEKFDKCRLPESALGKALTYACNQKPWLTNVFLDGRLELSNNRAENAIRPFTLGRKNWLFSNTPAGANASATVYSIIETAKANGLKPYEYIKFLLERLPQGVAPEDCLPWGEAAQQQCQ